MSNLTKEDVWGKFDEITYKKIHNGMIEYRYNEKCKYFGDILGYKSVTIVCNNEEFDEVSDWIDYVQGGGSISEVKDIENGKVAIRSNYMCW